MPAPPVLSCLRPVPSALTTQIVPLPLTTREKAILLPSGDHAGEWSRALEGALVIGVASVPSVFAIVMWLAGSGSVEYAIWVASGDGAPYVPFAGTTGAERVPSALSVDTVVFVETTRSPLVPAKLADAEAGSARSAHAATSSAEGFFMCETSLLRGGVPIW